MIGERFLPIGTVVLLKGGKKELMIMSHCIIPNGEGYDKKGKVNIEGKLFDYGACIYPEGMISSDQLFAFNHDQIDHIAYMGYQTDKQKELSKFLNESRNQYDKEKQQKAVEETTENQQ